jgi:hypothetical protein
VDSRFNSLDPVCSIFPTKKGLFICSVDVQPWSAASGFHGTEISTSLIPTNKKGDEIELLEFKQMEHSRTNQQQQSTNTEAVAAGVEKVRTRTTRTASILSVVEP